MKSEEIEQYLAELGEELAHQGFKKPVRILLIGGQAKLDNTWTRLLGLKSQCVYS